MGDEKHLAIIQISYLRELQCVFQKDASELIDIYLHDAKRKIANLHKALEEANYANFRGAAKELRLRSIDVGAIQFSYYCLQLEIAIQEIRLESVRKLILLLEVTFGAVQEALDQLKSPKHKKPNILETENS